MEKVLKIVLALLAAIATWFVVATVGNVVLRAAISGYRAQEVAMSFSLGAMLGRLAVGFLATVAACVVAVRMRRSAVMGVMSGCVLLALFVPVHLSLWTKFPIWYHLFFLASLPVVGLVTGRMSATK